MRQGSTVQVVTGERGKLLHFDGKNSWLVDFGDDRKTLVPREQIKVIISVIKLFPGVVIWVCDRDEANVLVRENRPEAWRIWLKEEVEKYILSSPDEIRSIIDKKKERPGPYLK